MTTTHEDIETTNARARMQRSNAPTVATILDRLGRYSIDRPTAEKIRGLMKGTVAPEEILGDDAYRQHYHLPPYYVRVLDAIDKLIGTFGIEYLRTRRGRYAYLNSGDTYTVTVVRCTSRHTWLITTWGDLAEREGTRDGENY